MTTPDDVFDLIDTPEDVTPRMAAEREISRQLLAALYLSLGLRSTYREAQKTRHKNSDRSYKLLTEESRAEVRRLFAEGKNKSEVARLCKVSSTSVFRILKEAEK